MNGTRQTYIVLKTIQPPSATAELLAEAEAGVLAAICAGLMNSNYPFNAPTDIDTIATSILASIAEERVALQGWCEFTRRTEQEQR
jgi:hypothetical protein